MSDGAESAMFKQLFKSWKDKSQTQGLGKTYTRGQIGTVFTRLSNINRIKYGAMCGCVLIQCLIAKVDQVKFNVMELHAEPKLAAQERMVDDASGEVKVRSNTCKQINTTKLFVPCNIKNNTA